MPSTLAPAELETFKAWKSGKSSKEPNWYVLAAAYEAICDNKQSRIDSDIEGLLEKLFSLPNWQRRIGEWKDVNEAIKTLHTVFAHREKVNAC